MAMAAIGVGLSKNPVVSERKEIASLPLPDVLPLSKKGEEDYPEIWKIHQASYLSYIEDVKRWVNCGTKFKKLDPNKSILDPIQLEHPESKSSSQPSLGEVILLRGSSRRFVRSPISFRQLSTILETSTRGYHWISLEMRKTKQILQQSMFI